MDATRTKQCCPYGLVFKATSTGKGLYHVPIGCLMIQEHEKRICGNKSCSWWWFSRFNCNFGVYNFNYPPFVSGKMTNSRGTLINKTWYLSKMDSYPPTLLQLWFDDASWCLMTFGDARYQLFLYCSCASTGCHLDMFGYVGMVFQSISWYHVVSFDKLRDFI